MYRDISETMYLIYELEMQHRGFKMFEFSGERPSGSVNVRSDRVKPFGFPPLLG